MFYWEQAFQNIANLKKNNENNRSSATQRNYLFYSSKSSQTMIEWLSVLINFKKKGNYLTKQYFFILFYGLFNKN